MSNNVPNLRKFRMTQNPNVYRISAVTFQAPADTVRAEVETEMKPEVNIAVTLVDRDQTERVHST